MEFSLKDLKELFIGNVTPEELPFKINDSILIRTLSYHYTGIVKEIKGKFVRLHTACWLSDSGRFYNALKTCSFDEVEPYINDVWINSESIVDFTYIDKVPTEQK